MIPRAITPRIQDLARQYPAVVITGPRQSGKTTLARTLFPDHAYVSLEDPDTRRFAATDPRRFLDAYGEQMVIDEVQRVPDLLSYLQGIIDKDGRPGRYVLTGSSNLLLMESVSQTLAGRVGLVTLLPFSLPELQEVDRAPGTLDSLLHTGLYPRIHDRGLDPREWYAGYISTFVERDVRRIVNIADLERFQVFLKLCAARSGQLLNLSALGTAAGVTHATARAWISILETLYIAVLLRPHHRNLSKRMVKAPKLYLLDPGLICYLMDIQTPGDLALHASRGAVFESWVVSELLKAGFCRGPRPLFHFWRDYAGHEVDLVLGSQDRPVPVEVKSGATVTDDWFSGLRFWYQNGGGDPESGWLMYGGDRDESRQHGRVVGWRSIGRLGELVGG